MKWNYLYRVYPITVKYDNWYIFIWDSSTLHQTFINSCQTFMGIILNSYPNKTFIFGWSNLKMVVKMYTTHRIGYPLLNFLGTFTSFLNISCILYANSIKIVSVCQSWIVYYRNWPCDRKLGTWFATCQWHNSTYFTTYSQLQNSFTVHNFTFPLSTESLIQNSPCCYNI